MQRPAYLTGAADLSERAVQGMGSVLPPHVSIGGNQFTLVDAAGNTKPLGIELHFLVTDIADHTCKMYYAKEYKNDSADPPDCWSANGVAPSIEAINPPMLRDGSRRVNTCAECPMNERGSRISKISGAAVKACRDEVWLAVVIPQFPTMPFQFRLTPGSFKNWRGYVEECKNLGKQTGAEEHVGTILTKATFEAGVNGVLEFKAVSYPDEATWKGRTAALSARMTDVLVGRNDRPRGLPAPAATPALAAPPPPNPQSTGFNPTANQPTTISVAPPAEQPARRGRKPRQQAVEPVQQAGPALAPFRPQASEQAAQGNGAPFGIAANPPNPSAEIQASLDQAFGAAPGTPGGGPAFGSQSGGFGQK